MRHKVLDTLFHRRNSPVQIFDESAPVCPKTDSLAVGWTVVDF